MNILFCRLFLSVFVLFFSFGCKRHCYAVYEKITVGNNASSCGISTIENLQNDVPQTVVVYGTSLTFATEWVSWLKSSLMAFGPATVIDAAKSSTESGWGVANFQARVLSHNPDMVIIEFSINDCFFRRGVAQARADTVTMISMARAAGVTDIVLAIMNRPYFELRPSHPNVEEYHAMYRELAASEGLLLVDYTPAWQAVVGQGEAYYKSLVPDDCHPNALGAQTAIVPVLESFLYSGCLL